MRGELALHNHMRRDTGVGGARLPQRLFTDHALRAEQRIHNGGLEGMAHVKAARDIGRRNHDAVGWAVTLRSEITVLFPNLIPALFDRVGVVSLVHEKSGCVGRSIGMSAARRAPAG